MKPVKIKVIEYEHFDVNDNSLGFLSDLENLELRCQIAETETEGYYLIAEGDKISITKKGEINWNKIPHSTWEAGSWDSFVILSSRLFKAQRIIKTK